MTIDQVLFRGVRASLDEIAIGASRIAGPPDLPAGVPWPTGPDGTRHLPLVLQLALADIAPFPAAARLPRDGVLAFFGAQLVQWSEAPAIDRIPAAVIYTPASAGPLVRHAMPPEATDDSYWDVTAVSRVVDWRAHVATGEDDEPTEPETHVLFPVRKYSSISGETPPEPFVPILEMRSDYDIAMNWGDAAWATWIVADAELVAGCFTDGYATVWIG